MEGIFTQAHKVEELFVHSILRLTTPGQTTVLLERIVGTARGIGNGKEAEGIDGIGKKWLWYLVVIVLGWFASCPSFQGRFSYRPCVNLPCD